MWFHCSFMFRNFSRASKIDFLTWAKSFFQTFSSSDLFVNRTFKLFWVSKQLKSLFHEKYKKCENLHKFWSLTGERFERSPLKGFQEVLLWRSVIVSLQSNKIIFLFKFKFFLKNVFRSGKVNFARFHNPSGQLMSPSDWISHRN